MINKTRMLSLEPYRKDFAYLGEKTIRQLGRNPGLAWSVILVRDAEIHKVNREYRHIDRPTDVISFALRDSVEEAEQGIEEVADELGDIFISYDAALRQAKEYRHSLRREICFLYEHGLLHLMGFDHQTREDEKKMFAIQRQILDDYIPFEAADEP